MAEDLEDPEHSILIADRGYESYNVLAHLDRTGTKYLIRIKAPESNGILSEITRSGMDTTGAYDHDVWVILTRSRKKAHAVHSDGSTCFYDRKRRIRLISRNREYILSFRILCVKLEDGKLEYFATDLDRETFPPKEIRTLYHMRWGIETSFRDLKHTACLLQLHAKKERAIIQEFYARILMHTFCAMVTGILSVNEKKNP